MLAVSLAAQGGWTPKAQVRMKAVGAPQISPDNKRIAYTVNEAVMPADRSEFVTQIWLANADGANAFQVMFGEKSSVTRSGFRNVNESMY